MELTKKKWSRLHSHEYCKTFLKSNNTSTEITQKALSAWNNNCISTDSLLKGVSFQAELPEPLQMGCYEYLCIQIPFSKRIWSRKLSWVGLFIVRRQLMNNTAKNSYFFRLFCSVSSDMLLKNHNIMKPRLFEKIP